MTTTSKRVRSPKTVRDLVLSAVGASDDAVGNAFVSVHFTKARAKQVVSETQLKFKEGEERGTQGERLTSLCHDLGQAAMVLTRQRGPTRDKRIDVLRRIATAAAALHRLMTAKTEGRRIWSETQRVTSETQRNIISTLGKQASSGFDGYVDRTFFPDAVRIIEELANDAIARAERDRGRGQYDPLFIRHPGTDAEQEVYPEAADITEYVAHLAWAYYNFFGVEPGISTDWKSRRSGPFIRFAQAASKLIGVTLTPDQIRHRFRAWKGRFRDQ